MSKLAEELADTASNGVRGDLYDSQEACASSLADYYLTLLPAHDAEVAAKARKEALEAACLIKCGRCRVGAGAQPSTSGHTDASVYPYEHFANDYSMPCWAGDLRAEFKRRWPEEFGGVHGA